MQVGIRSVVLLLLACWIRNVEGDEPDDAQRDAHRARMKRVAASLQIADTESGKGGKSGRLVPEPILRYTDATRKTHESAIWIWGEKSRPLAIMAIEFYPNYEMGPRWLYEIASVSDRRISAKRATELEWSAKKPGLSLQELPEAGVPADQPARRLSQMKRFLRRFSAHETATIEGRIELRPLANPLHRYQDPDSALIDGAIFAFANGTNPEVFLLLEAHSTQGRSGGWKYSLAQMTGEKVSVSLDGVEVWNREGANPPADRDSYVNGWLRPEPE